VSYRQESRAVYACAGLGATFKTTMSGFSVRRPESQSSSKCPGSATCLVGNSGRPPACRQYCLEGRLCMRWSCTPSSSPGGRRYRWQRHLHDQELYICAGCLKHWELERPSWSLLHSWTSCLRHSVYLCMLAPSIGSRKERHH
jgi:hypothetical protein